MFQNFTILKYILLYVIIFYFGKSQANIIQGDPTNYVSKINNLSQGDTLKLSSGKYADQLNIYNIIGSQYNPIVIIGNGDSTEFVGSSCCNTISIKNSAFVTLTQFKLNGNNIVGIDACKVEGIPGNWAHHITLDQITIIDYAGNQQSVGISTKSPVWNMVIKNCIITNVGTGMYLGNSDGEQPFVNGLIENNFISNTIGYNIEIKHQNNNSRNASGMTLNGKTIIRDNVFSKEKNSSSGINARPNVLVGSYPTSGNGANDIYEIYGNFFWQNPYESLFQGNGNVIFYNNIGINHSGGNGFTFQAQNGTAPHDIRIFNNTVYTGNLWGIRLMDVDSSIKKFIIGNAVFSDHSTPIRMVGTGLKQIDSNNNIVIKTSTASAYINHAGPLLNDIDFYPKSNSKLKGNIISKTLFTTFSDYNKDFNHSLKSWNYKGAYDGEGSNPGWKLALSRKNTPIVQTSINQINQPIEINIYPNPNNGDFNIDCKGIEGQSIIVKIFDYQGKFITQSNSLNTSFKNFKPGIYSVLIVNSNKIFQKNIIIN